MPNPIVGAAGASILGGAMSSRAASSASRRAGRSEAASLAFEQQRYDDWKDIYGPIQENLSDYYMNLSADQYEVMGLEAFEEEKARSLQNITESLSQRGISDSGLAAAADINIELDAAETRAGIRRDAPARVAEEQMRFLQVGLNQNPEESMSRTLANQAQSRRQQANVTGQAAGQAIGTAISATGTALADYYDDSGM